MRDSIDGESETKGLVVFDVEGVLLPKRRYIPFEATKRLGFQKFLKILIYGMLYEIGFSPLEVTLKKIFSFFRGYTLRELRYYYRKLPLLPDTKEVFRSLQRDGWKTALISSGLPQPFIQELANTLGADYAYGLELKTVNHRFTGEIAGQVMKRNGKAIILQEILHQENMSYQDCILVADDRNNLQIFPYAYLKIGYNPDFLLAAKSDHVITQKLTAILPIITKRDTGLTKTLITKNQILRTTIHLGGFIVPFISTYYLHRQLIASIILIVTLIYLISELARITGIRIPIIAHITRNAAVKLEPYEFATAPIYYALGIILPLIIFPSSVAYASITILTIGDGIASFLGQKIGKTTYPYNKSKSLEGSISGFIPAFLAANLFIDSTRAFTAAAIGMLVESLPTPIDDNLIIPVTTAIILTLTLI